MTGPRYRLDPHLAVLCRPDGSAQIGWDPRRAVLVRPDDGLDPAGLAAVLAELQAGAELSSLTARYPGPVIDELVRGLRAAGLLDVAPSAVAVRTPVIRVHGPGPIATALADGLRCSGARISRSTGPHFTVSPAGTDLVLLADTQVVNPRLVRELTRGRVAHLPVRFRDGLGVVGPLVLPGTTSCLRCADLHRTDRDPEWPALAAQLRDRVGSADRATLLATVALALRQVSAVMAAVRSGGSGSGPAPATLWTTLEVDVGAGSILTRRWPKHPACGC